MKKFAFFVFINLFTLISFDAHSETLLFLSDLEGNIGKWDAFIKTSGCFMGSSPPINVKQSGYQNVQNLMRTRPFTLNPGCRFFYLGDVVDKGEGSIRILRDLVYLKTSNPGGVFLTPGNRELNKLRWLQEISPNGEIDVNNFYRFTQSKISPGLANNLKELNENYFGKSFGAPMAMEFRSAELGLGNLKNSNYSEWSKKILTSLRQDVESFDDLPNSGPSKGLILRYLQLSQMLIRYNDMILSHGFIGSDNFGRVPKIGARSVYGVESDTMSIKGPGDFQQWNLKLNEFLTAMLKTLISKNYSEKVDEKTRYLGEELILYQEPTLKIRPGRPNDFNQESVVLGRNSNADDFGNAFNLSLGNEGVLSETLNSIGIKIRIAGHTPVGQNPLIQKIINKKKPNDPPTWSINIDASAEHTKMPKITTLFKLIDNNTFYAKSFVTIGGSTGYSKIMETSFKKDGKDGSRIGETVICQNKAYTVVGEFKKGTYLLYRSEAGFATNNMESNLNNCTTN
jgi:hypothetical protein